MGNKGIMKKWMLSLVLPIIGILGLWLFSGQKVNATPTTLAYVGQKELNSLNNYTADGTTAIPDPGEGHRDAGYALFDASTGTLTLHNFTTDQTAFDNKVNADYTGCIYCEDDLIINLEGNNELSMPKQYNSFDDAAVQVLGNLVINGDGNGTGVLTATGGYNICTGFIANSCGILSDGDLTINNAKIFAKGEHGRYLSCGLFAGGNIQITGGRIDASCTNGNHDFAVLSVNSINLSPNMKIVTPVGASIGGYILSGNTMTVILDGSTPALHAIISDHDENNGSGDGSGNSAGKACNHDYQWTVEREPTITEDGEEVYKCTKCGDISARQPLSAAGFCFLDAEGKVRNAKAGQTLKLNFKQWNSIPKAFFEELAKRRDITVVIRFTYKHKTYEMTVTPDMVIDISHDYYGPEKLILLYGAKEVNG